MSKQETAEDSMARLQSKFQNLNVKVYQNVDRQTYGHHQSISRNCFAIRSKITFKSFFIIINTLSHLSQLICHVTSCNVLENT